MTLAAGTRLGPYEIVAPLGAGGMGEVYRAKDPRLGREVAIKVLPASFSQDADRLKRFEQEARAAGVLNHPNITAVHDLGSHGGAPYIVTELLEGETLRSRLAGGALPPRKAIDYAVQIAKGLAAAHEKGIVHRDLKPENLFVTNDGRVKILDFGLAKLTQREGEPRQQTNLPTATAGTEPGVVMGTLGYMSPEQVKGKPADARSDIFSFGAILYEMLSGTRAFHRDSAAETMSAILKEEPPDLSATNKNVAPGLERIVRHCLEKSPEERFHSAHDLGFDLAALSGVSATGRVAVATSPTARRRAWLPLGAAALAVGGMVAAFVVGKKAGYVPPPFFRQLTFRRGEVQSARFAPDGQTVIYTAAWDGKPMEIFFRRLESPESRPSGQSNAELLAVSDSGDMAVSIHRVPLGAFARTGRLASMSIAGGVAPREILDDVQWADWSPNGKDLAIVRDVSGRNRLEYPAGKGIYETAGWISSARVSPGGDLVAFCDHPTPGDDGGFVAVVDRSGRKRNLAGPFSTVVGLSWSPRGGEVWFTAADVGGNRALHAVTLAGQRRLLARVTGSLTLQDIARDGRVLITHDTSRQGIIGLAPGEAKERELSWLDYSSPRDLSADGTLLLFDESGEGGGEGYSVYIRKTDGSPATRLGQGGASRLSPDGKWALALVSMGSAGAQLVAYPTGVGEPKRVATEGLGVQYSDWLPDEKTLVLTASEPGHGTRLYLLPFDGGKPRAITPEGYREVRRGISPDGRSIVVTGPDQRFYVYPAAGGEPVPVPGVTPQDRFEGWSSDGRSLFVHRRGVLPARIDRLDVATGKRDLWKETMPLETAGLGDIGGVLVTPDGRSYVYGTGWTLSDLYLVEGLK